MRKDIAVGLIVASVAWLASMFFPQGRDWWLDILSSGWHGIRSAYTWLGADVSTPRALYWFLWLFLLLVVGVFVAAWLEGWRQKPQPTPQSLSDQLRLSDDERKILRALAEGDGRELWFSHVQELLNSSKLRAEHAVASLRRQSFIEWFSDFEHGGSAHLTSKGRALCVMEGWAK